MERNPDPAAASDQDLPPLEFLTPREREIAGLVACGHSNRKIAEELVIADSTAERHVANILAKLNMRSRAEIAVWAVEHRLARPPASARHERTWWSPSGMPTLSQRRSNLPAGLNSFVGREGELRRLTALLPTTRLLTLTGTGGIGKTRLALRVAADAQANYPHGVWLVRLDALADPELVQAAIASVLEVHEQPGRSLLESLTGTLGSRYLLLVLDNCEHVIEASAKVAQALLETCPKLQLLATSREPLNVAGEYVWRVPSLSLPQPHHATAADQLGEFEAVRLFIERTQAVRPGFVVTNDNAPAISLVCRRLDGIPLAIELAAARVKGLSVEQLAQRVDDRLRLLTGGSRTALPRQQTLRAAIDWSYDLLSEPERVLFQRLSVFAGGLTLEGAEAVCTSEEMAREEVLERLCSLVDKSLVSAQEENGAQRYRLLETIRRYALERLETSGELDTVRRRHVEHFLAFSERAEPELRGAQQVRWVAVLEVEHDNLRAALRWCVEFGEAELGIRLGAALQGFWLMHGHLREGRERLLEVLGLSEATTDTQPLKAVRASALSGAGFLALRQSDYAAAHSLLEESLAMRRALGDRQAIAISLNDLGVLADDQGDYALASSLGEESLAIKREFGDQFGIANSLHNLGVVAQHRTMVSSLNNRGTNDEDPGDYAVAHSLLEEGLAIRRQLGDLVRIAGSLNQLGLVADSRGDYAAAHSLYAESLAISREIGNTEYVGWSLMCFTTLYAAQGQAGRSLRLDGAAARLRDALGTPLPAIERKLLERRLQTARKMLSEEAGAAAWAEGQAMPLEEAIAYAMEEAVLG